jgi:hypothetical protein
MLPEAQPFKVLARKPSNVLPMFSVPHGFFPFTPFRVRMTNNLGRKQIRI